jgi:hypothetical protein
VLRELREKHRHGEWLFTNPASGKPFGKPGSDKTDALNALAQEELEKLEPGATLERFTWNTMRHTATTIMLRLGVQQWVADACLDHAQGMKMLAVYGHHKFDVEKRRALFALGRYVELALQPPLYAACHVFRQRGNDLEARDAAHVAFCEAIQRGGTPWADYLVEVRAGVG